ncbi:hypothetical protein GPEL0_01f1051 [Geoanaerobacter pelophilus]|uniref:Uncharacterized protein n=2 Tax=Geoanaerobacter pelophilus TaxID=60036 RepID=A0ABQ0MFQ3_9BACT|nr:hypothetical protein GPEL0_01f1051 [Geoanaerobacter pelophilus]
MVHESGINTITKKLFNLPLSEFVHLKDRTSNKRKYRDAWSFNEQIIILANDYTKRKNISIEINGSAFDHVCINVEKVCKLIEQDFIVSALDAKIDTLETPFKQLFKCYQHDAVTASTLKRSDRQSKTKTITFGSSPEYQIYQAGLYHEHIKDPNLTRHELKFQGKQAQEFFNQWRRDPENLEQLIKSFIIGQFNVQFKQLTDDSNVGRRPVLPMWQAWTSTAAPRRFDRVTPTKPQVANQQKNLEARLLRSRLEIGEGAYQDALESVAQAYYLDRHPNERSPEHQLTFDFVPQFAAVETLEIPAGDPITAW